MSWSLLLTGMPNSGKSTIAYYLVQKKVRNVLIIDGDKHREMQFLGEKLGFSKADILRNTEHVVKMAQFAQEQGFNVIIAQIAPYVEQRDSMSVLENFMEVRCVTKIAEHRPNYVSTDIKYEDGDPEIILDTDVLSIKECCEAVFDIMSRSGFIN